MTFKITLTVCFLFAYFFLKYAMRWSSRHLEQRLKKRDPKAAEKLSWFFSEKRMKIQEGLLLVFIVLFLAILWLGATEVPE
jgi:hypothetical protein